jgi:hypothetical protein
MRRGRLERAAPNRRPRPCPVNRELPAGQESDNLRPAISKGRDPCTRASRRVHAPPTVAFRRSGKAWNQSFSAYPPDMGSAASARKEIAPPV